jgi:hypothetical protein
VKKDNPIGSRWLGLLSQSEGEDFQTRKEKCKMGEDGKESAEMESGGNQDLADHYLLKRTSKKVPCQTVPLGVRLVN